jgi:hypothetical protein
LQNDSVLYHAVAIKLNRPLKAALIDACAEAETCRSGKIVYRASLSPNCGIRVHFDWPLVSFIPLL